MMASDESIARCRFRFPHNALVVVHGIVLNRATNPPIASGGELVEIAPWDIIDDDLTVISYFYRTGV